MQQLWQVLGPDGSRYVIWLTLGLVFLIGLLLVIWVLTRLFGRNLNMGANGRAQQQRLGITGAFNLDRKGRKLVIVRRDNVEHLLLIGGPNDVMVESNILRVERTIRPATVAVPSLAQPATTEADHMPATPVTASVVSAPVSPVIPVHTPQPPESVAKPASVPVPPNPDSAPPRPETFAMPALAPTQPLPPQMPARPVPPPPAARIARPPAPTPPQQVQALKPPPSNAPDPVLSEMARKLQNVLKNPAASISPRKPDREATAKSENIPIPLPSTRPATSTTPMPQGQPVPPAPPKAETPASDSLEEEMARLLGRTGPKVS